MRLNLKLLLLAATVAFLGSVSLMAQAKVGIINIQRAMLDTAQIKKAQAELEAKFKPRQDELEAVSKELQTIQKQLEGGAQSLTPSQTAELQSRGQLLQRRAQRLQEDLQADITRERDAILASVGQRLQEIVNKIAAAKDLDVLVDVSNAVYFKPALEVTDEAVAAFDKAYPVN
ncbi:MAG: OmpH family outer membrane protein [Bryobacterales bacterium]|jgi:outer membrane protein|nr:OmpH family outer membrane protein [Bryobacterales bacterium]